MADRTLVKTRTFLVLIVAICLLAGIAAAVKAEEPQDIVKGTVVELKNGTLTLKAVRFQDPTIPPQTLKIMTDKGTAYYDGPIQVTKEAIVEDLLVLVRCTLVGSERKAVLVRIIGGKKS